MRGPLLSRAACAAALAGIVLYPHINPAALHAASAACTFDLVEPGGDGTPGKTKHMSAGDPICVKAMALLDRFDKLKTGASAWARKLETKSLTDGQGKPLRMTFDPADIRLSGHIDNVDSPNAYYAFRHGSSRPGYIQVNVGFVNKERGPDSPAAFGLSHELAHGVQHALEVKSVRCHRGHEAQADRWGAAIMREAGLPGEKSPEMVADFFGEDRIASDRAAQLEAEGCKTHPPGRTRFVNAVLAEELFGKKNSDGGSAIGRKLMKLDREKVLAAADIVFDGGAERKESARPVPAREVKGDKSFGSDGVLRKEDFKPNGKLIVSKDIVPNIKPSKGGVASPHESDLTHIVLGQIYRLGNLTDWTSPFIGKIIAKGVKDKPGSVKEALFYGLERMAPSETAKKNTLRLVVALQDSLGGGPLFAFLRPPADAA